MHPPRTSDLSRWSRLLEERFPGAVDQLRGELGELRRALLEEKEHALRAERSRVGQLERLTAAGGPEEVTAARNLLDKERRDLRKLSQSEARTLLAEQVLERSALYLPRAQDVVWSLSRSCTRFRRGQGPGEQQVPIGIRMHGPARLLLRALPDELLDALGAYRQGPTALGEAWCGVLQPVPLRPLSPEPEPGTPVVEVAQSDGTRLRYTLLPGDLSALAEDFSRFEMAVPSGRTPTVVAPADLSEVQWEVYEQLAKEGTPRHLADGSARMLAD